MKVKVFAVKKEKEDEITNRTGEKISYIKLFNEDKFNYIVIRNPWDSNEICTIKDIKILNVDSTNGLCLMQGEDEKLKEREKIGVVDKVGIFNIESRFQDCEDNKKLQLCRNQLVENKECNILGDSVLIVLPKGCLFIKLDNEVAKLDVNINWTSESIG
jgi:hypothetical protein